MGNRCAMRATVTLPADACLVLLATALRMHKAFELARVIEGPDFEGVMRVTPNSTVIDGIEGLCYEGSFACKGGEQITALIVIGPPAPAMVRSPANNSHLAWH